MKPTISIIIPCYNCEDTIEEAVQSVERGCIDDYEVLLINDGSKDGTQSVIDKLKERNPRCVTVNKANGGASSARNCALDICTGKYIIFLDSDDLLADGYLASVKKIVTEADVDVVSNYRTTELSSLGQFRNAENGSVSDIDMTQVLREITFTKKIHGFTTYVYKAEIINDNNIRFVENVKYGEDWEFTTKFLAHCKSAKELKQFCYYYRYNPSSISNTVKYNQTDAIGSALRTGEYLENMHHPFSADFNAYMYSRTVFTVAHRFAKAGNKELLKKLTQEYDVKDAMRKLYSNKNADKPSRISAFLYLVSPGLFSIVSRIK